MISLESTCKCFQYGEIILLLKGEFRDLIGGGIRVLWTYQSSVFECNELQSLARSWDAKFSSWCQSLYNNNYDVCWEYQWELNLQNSKSRRLELTATCSKKKCYFVSLGWTGSYNFISEFKNCATCTSFAHKQRIDNFSSTCILLKDNNPH